MANGAFSCSVEKDPKTGWNIVVLRYADSTDSSRNLEARIAPDAGSNLYSLKAGGTEILVVPESLSELPGYRYGFPVLYPTPNRVANSQFTFDGQTYKFHANDSGHFLHGLVHSLRWKAGNPETSSSGVSLRTWLDWESSQPQFPSCPFVHRITLTFKLTDRGVRFEFLVENEDEKRLPFGFALHPWFRILGTRAQTFLQVPARKHMEAVGLIPTGRLMELQGSPLDLRKPVSLEKLDLDDVYWGMTSEDQAGYEARDKGVKVRLTGSDEFTHMVIYTPKGKPFFCMENQTCSTDAHNLFVRGFQKESNLLVAERGKSVAGWVELSVENSK